MLERMERSDSKRSGIVDLGNVFDDSVAHLVKRHMGDYVIELHPFLVDGPGVTQDGAPKPPLLRTDTNPDQKYRDWLAYLQQLISYQGDQTVRQCLCSLDSIEESIQPLLDALALQREGFFGIKRVLVACQLARILLADADYARRIKRDLAASPSTLDELAAGLTQGTGAFAPGCFLPEAGVVFRASCRAACGTLEPHFGQSSLAVALQFGYRPYMAGRTAHALAACTCARCAA